MQDSKKIATFAPNLYLPGGGTSKSELEKICNLRILSVIFKILI